MPDIPDLSKPTLFWDQTGRMFKCTLNVQQVMNADEVLKRAAESTATATIKWSDDLLIAAFANGDIAVATKRKEFIINSVTALINYQDKPVLIPTPHQSNGPRLELKAPIESYFVTAYRKADRAFTPYQVLVDAPNKRTYKLPAPNVFDDGRLCLGSGSVYNAAESIEKNHRKGIERWESAVANADLYNYQQQYETIFRFDAGTKAWIPYTGNLYQQCQAVSNTYTNWLTQLV